MVPAAVVLVPVGLWVLAARLVGVRPPLVHDLSLGGPPLIGHWNLVIPPPAAVPVAIGVAVVWWLPRAAAGMRWATLLLTAWATSAAFATALAAVDGWDAVAEPLRGRYEYRSVLTDIHRLGVGDFVSTFVDHLADYPTHVRGHPVAIPLVFWLQERIGLHGAGWSAALVIVAGTSTVVSVAVTVRVVVGETAARRAVPFLVAVPALVWVATSADAFVAGVVGAAIALFAVAAARGGWSADLLAAIGGATAALALHLSYGTVPMLLPVAFVVVGQRRIRPLLVGAAGAAVITAAFAGAGFWWFDGLAATRAQYSRGAGGVRPLWYFAALGNPAALLIALGPAIPVALARLRDRRLWLVTAGALLGVVLADLSGLSKGEVERIWLPFVPWLVASSAALPLRSARWWLAAQVSATVALQLALESPW